MRGETVLTARRPNGRLASALSEFYAQERSRSDRRRMRNFDLPATVGGTIGLCQRTCRVRRRTVHLLCCAEEHLRYMTARTRCDQEMPSRRQQALPSTHLTLCTDTTAQPLLYARAPA